jgi:hypothetical protein
MSVKKDGALRIADEIIAVAHNADVMMLIVFTDLGIKPPFTGLNVSPTRQFRYTPIPMSHLD